MDRRDSLKHGIQAPRPSAPVASVGVAIAGLLAFVFMTHDSQADEAAANSKPKKMGTLILKVQPADVKEVDIFLNDKFLATAGCRDQATERIAIEEGQHRLKVTSFGHEPHAQPLTMKSASSEIVSVQLEPVDKKIARWFKAINYPWGDLHEDGRIHTLGGDHRMTDELLQKFGQLARLENLSLGPLVTDDGLKHLRRLTSLKMVTCYDAYISEDGLKHLTGNTELANLGLRDTLITDKGLETLNAFKKLGSLSLDQCDKITGEGLEHLKANEFLFHLHLSSCPKITDKGLAGIKSLRHLKALAIGDMPITDAALAFLQHLPGLERLDLVQTKVTGEGFASIKKTSVKELYLAKSPIKDAALKHVAELKKLHHLDLAHTQVTDKGIGFLAPMEVIVKLNLTGTAVTDKCLRHLTGMELHELDLTDTVVSDVGIGHLVTFKHLSAIGLANTSVTSAGRKMLKDRFPRCQVR